ncbi:MAG: fumarate hydratase [Calditrichaeota bacterium]|nr:fumarate hydratase [Calditrichota bacterium]
MSYETLRDNLLELIRRTSAYLPPDVEEVINLKKNLEAKNSMAEMAMDMIMQNVGLAKKRSLPICQDTGTITFYVKCPVNYDQLVFEKAAEEAVVQATEKGYLRQNSVDSLSGKNTGNNLGKGSPVFHFHQTRGDDVDVRLILKGGGCENMSIQYKLPATLNGKKYGRDLKGVRAVILDAVYQAQGKGCGPGFLGVCIGGDRASSYAYAKELLLRSMDEVNPLQELAQLEETIMEEANTLEIGPMGFGGKFTLGGINIDYLNRLPASYFVSIAYMCWAYRRRGLVMTSEGEVKEWLYQTPGEFEEDFSQIPEMEMPSKNVKVLTTPVSEEQIRDLKVGDVVLLNGDMFTGRDAVHRYLYDGGELDVIKGGIIYHCGPVIVKEGGEYKVMAAGPTTSIREEPYQGDVIGKFNIRGVIGKGGMGGKTLEACSKYGSVYFHAIGGAAQIYAKCVKKVKGVYLEQFGSPEAVWHFDVENFPLVVTMDSHNNSLHDKVDKISKEKLEKILNK